MIQTSRSPVPTAVSSRRSKATAALPKHNLMFSTLLASFVSPKAACADNVSPVLESLRSVSRGEQISTASTTFVNQVAELADVALSGAEDGTPLVAGLAAGIVVAGGAVAFLNNSKPVKGLSPAAVANLLEDDPSLQVLDIRTKAELSEQGTPDLRTFNKSPITSTYQPTPTSQSSKSKSSTVFIGWPERVCRIGKIGMDKPVLLLDSDGSVAPKAAKELAAASTERPSVIFVNGGAAAWQAAELPWKQPLRLGFNFDSLKNLAGGGGSGGTAASGEKKVAESVKKETVKKAPSKKAPRKIQSRKDPQDKEDKKDSNLVTGGIAALAVAGASVFRFTEIEAVLQVVGVVGSVQFLASRLLFAEDRQKTLDDVKYLLQDKIDAGTAGEDLRRLGETVLSAQTAEDVTETARNMPPAGLEGSPSGSTAAFGGTVKILIANQTSQAPGKEGAQAWISAWREKNPSYATENCGSETGNGTVRVSVTNSVIEDVEGKQEVLSSQ